MLQSSSLVMMAIYFFSAFTKVQLPGVAFEIIFACVEPGCNTPFTEIFFKLSHCEHQLGVQSAQ